MVLIFLVQCLPSGRCSINTLIISSYYSGYEMFVSFHKAMSPLNAKHREVCKWLWGDVRPICWEPSLRGRSSCSYMRMRGGYGLQAVVGSAPSPG